MSDTPRTDAAEKHAYEYDDDMTPVVESKVARQLERELAEAKEQRETLEGMYHKVVSACLRCDPIPASQREDDELEPPWEVVDRVKRQRDRLAEAVESFLSQQVAPLAPLREALAAAKGEEPVDPHKYCRGGGGNNFHCGCKYDAQNHESYYP
jgi:preprotein translocase subunit SecA